MRADNHGEGGIMALTALVMPRGRGARVGGLVLLLRRTRVGPFTAEQGVTIEATAEEAWRRVRPVAAIGL